MQKIHTMLWFDGRAEEAARFYTSVFKNSKLGAITPMTVQFELEGREFTALNGGPQFTFNEAISFVIDCGPQDEVDYYWNALTADGGAESMCGWLKDKFGVSWQVVPRRLMELLNHQDRGVSQRAMQAMLQMRKIDIAALEAAANG